MTICSLVQTNTEVMRPKDPNPAHGNKKQAIRLQQRKEYKRQIIPYKPNNTT